MYSAMGWNIRKMIQFLFKKDTPYSRNQLQVYFGIWLIVSLMQLKELSGLPGPPLSLFGEPLGGVKTAHQLLNPNALKTIQPTPQNVLDPKNIFQASKLEDRIEGFIKEGTDNTKNRLQILDGMKPTELVTPEIKISDEEPKMSVQDYLQQISQSPSLSKKDEIMDGYYHMAKTLNVQESYLLHLNKENLEAHNNFEFLKAGMRSKMHSDYNKVLLNVESLAKELKLSSIEVKNKWNEIVSESIIASQKTNIPPKTGFWRNLFNIIFKNSEWRKVKFDRSIQQLIQNTKGKSMSPSEKIVFELNRHYQEGMPLTKKELNLLWKISRDHTLSEKELKHINSLESFTILSRRVDFAQNLMKKISKMGDRRKNISIERAYKALISLLESQTEGKPWTAEEIRVVNFLDKAKNLKQLEALGENSVEKITLDKLFQIQLAKENRNINDRVKKILELKALYSSPKAEAEGTAKSMEGNIFGSGSNDNSILLKETIGDLNGNKNVENLDKAEKIKMSNLYLKKLNLISEFALPSQRTYEDQLPVQAAAKRRLMAIEYLQRLEKEEGNLSETERSVLENLQKSHDPEVKFSEEEKDQIRNLEGDFKKIAHKFSDVKKAYEVLRIMNLDVMKEFDIDPELVQTLRGRLQELIKVSESKGKNAIPTAALDKTDQMQIKHLSYTYDLIVETMSEEDRALAQLLALESVKKSQKPKEASASSAILSPEEIALKDKLSKNSIDNKTRFLIASYSMLLPKRDQFLRGIDPIGVHKLRFINKVELSAQNIVQNKVISEMPNDLPLLKNLKDEERKKIINLMAEGKGKSEEEKVLRVREILEIAARRLKLEEEFTQLKFLRDLGVHEIEVRNKEIERARKRLEKIAELTSGLEKLDSHWDELKLDIKSAPELFNLKNQDETHSALKSGDSPQPNNEINRQAKSTQEQAQSSPASQSEENPSTLIGTETKLSSLSPELTNEEKLAQFDEAESSSKRRDSLKSSQSAPDISSSIGEPKGWLSGRIPTFGRSQNKDA
ncbi:hypothetical protein BY996DRAFT_2037700 [Phakopsora pachyrhizi]|uniref:Expressed protein n=1 Tax=Phakopsora pachyrhizi TaxID=170000 RepID=A0AAV0BBX2_PHAPC|nr:hypothetical protein BY996DRAFT_2037700 [Phakopsora pachyrhizi]CAH7684152.1 expressed protein [Phakopsora pachyrhizi]